MNQLEPFDIRNFSERLTILKEESTQLVCECPVCGGHRLTINKKSGAYKCWSGDCAVKDIREEVSPMNQIQGDRFIKYVSSINRSKTNVLSSNAPIPAASRISLAKLPAPADIPQKQQRLDPDRGEVWETRYPYSDTQWVQRTEWIDPNTAKGRDKKTLPYHVTGEDEIKCGKGGRDWQPYRLDEVEKYGLGKWVVGFEGENCVEAGRQLQLVSFTFQGGSWTNIALDSAMLQMKRADIAGVVYLPDHDDAGRKKAKKVALAAANVEMPLLIIEPLALWEDMPEAGDIVDWVKWGKAQGMEHDDFIRRLEEEIHFSIAAALEEQKRSDPDERLKLDLHALLKEPDPIKRMRRRAEIASHYRLKTSDIQEALKYIEQQTLTPQKTCFTFDEFFNQESDEIQWVVPQLLPRAETILLAAQAKCGKTALATDIMYAVLSGGTVLGEQVGIKGKVLLISSDESPNSTRRRMRARGFDLLEERSNFQLMTHLDITNLASLEAQLEEQRPDLVVIDSLTTICLELGISEKDPEFARYIYKLKALLGRYNAACILTHHENKDALAKGINQVSGSARIPAAVWGILQLKAVDPNNDADSRRWLKLKPREGEATTFNLELNPSDTWLHNGIWSCLGEVGDTGREKKTQGDRVLELLRDCQSGGLTYQEIDNALSIGKNLYKVLDRLESRHLVSKRRLETNSRSWIYLVKDDVKKAGDTPPPPVDPTNIVQYSKTPPLTKLQQLDNQLDNNWTTIGQPSDIEGVSNCSKPLSVNNSAPIGQMGVEGGGVGVESSWGNVVSSCVKTDFIAPPCEKLSVSESSPAVTNRSLADISSVTDSSPTLEPDLIAEYLTDSRQVLPLQTEVNQESSSIVTNHFLGKVNGRHSQEPTFRSFRVGDHVFWDNCPSYCAWGNPFLITAIEADKAMLDLITRPVPLTDLRFQQEEISHD